MVIVEKSFLAKHKSLSPSVIEDAKEGKLLMLFDDINENEADFVLHPTKINFKSLDIMRVYGSGIVSLALEQKKIKELGLDLSIVKNRDKNTPPLICTFDAAFGIRSGISFEDKVNSILTASCDSATRSDIKIPGHIRLLCSDIGGISSRTGHTESSIEIMKRAGLSPSAVISEVINTDGSVANYNEVLKLSEKLGIQILLISSLLKKQ